MEHIITLLGYCSYVQYCFDKAAQKAPSLQHFPLSLFLTVPCLKHPRKPAPSTKGKPHPGGEQQDADDQGGFVRLAEGARRIPTALFVFAEAPQFHGAAYHVNTVQRWKNQREKQVVVSG